MVRICKVSLGLVTGFALLAPAGQAGGVPSFSGELLGQVENSAGIAQMGAGIFLYNRYDQLVRQSLTNSSGKFAFDSLPPDLYAVRVVLASFVPAIKRNISVAAGSQNLLKINLASVLSTVELVPESAAEGALMTDDWKWVLRSSQATRPVLRLMPVASSSSQHSTLATFSDTTGVLRLSAGDGDSVSGSTAQDLGTEFALATLVNGTTRVRLSGNVGYMANSGLPAAGFRTTYSRDEDGTQGPQIALTVHQIYFPGVGPAGNSNSEAGPVLRTAAFGAKDKMDLSDHLQLEYGGHIESVALLGRVTYLSPFARATYDFGERGALRVAFSSGTQPTELMTHASRTQDGEVNPSSDLNDDLEALSILPRISLRNDQMRLQRNETWEAGYEVKEGSRTYLVSAYTEDMSDAAYTAFGAVGYLPGGDLLRDFDSTSYIFDVGDYRRTGYSAAVTQSMGEHMDLTVAGGRGGGLEADEARLVRKAERAWLSVRASATLPSTGTHVITSYGWSDPGALMPIHFSLTGPTYQDVGFNIVVRQPLPKIGGVPGRIEATAEMRNALGQGYLPIGPAGNRTLLTTSPRALRGGLAFLF